MTPKQRVRLVKQLQEIAEKLQQDVLTPPEEKRREKYDTRCVATNEEMHALKKHIICTLRPLGEAGMERTEFMRTCEDFCNNTWGGGYCHPSVKKVAYSMVFGGTEVPWLLFYPGTTRVAITSKEEDERTIRENYFRKPKPRLGFYDGAGI